MLLEKRGEKWRKKEASGGGPGFQEKKIGRTSG